MPCCVMLDAGGAHLSRNVAILTASRHQWGATRSPTFCTRLQKYKKHRKKKEHKCTCYYPQVSSGQFFFFTLVLSHRPGPGAGFLIIFTATFHHACLLFYSDLVTSCFKGIMLFAIRTRLRIGLRMHIAVVMISPWFMDFNQQKPPMHQQPTFTLKDTEQEKEKTIC